METLGRLGWRTSLYNVSLAQDVPSLWRFRALGVSFGGGGGVGGGGDSFRRLAGGLYAHDHLLAAQEGVANELARAQSHLRVRHVGWLIVVDRGRRVVFCVGVHACCFKRRRRAAVVRISFLAAQVGRYCSVLAIAASLDIHLQSIMHMLGMLLMSLT